MSEDQTPHPAPIPQPEPQPDSPFPQAPLDFEKRGYCDDYPIQESSDDGD